VALAALVAGAFTLGWGSLMASALPRGVALAPVGLGTAVVFLAYAAAATGTRPSRAGLRALLAA
jgi:hypothetical protein